MNVVAARTTIGPYRIVRTLGTGGWSTVYEVTSPDGATLALKRLRDDLPASALARFRREVESLRSIDHPGVLRLVDWGLDGAAPYLVTPRLDGQTLRQLLADGPLGIEGALLIVGAAAEAVGAIHAAGLIHRDLKPENLMVTSTGDVVVIDLGLALGPDHSRHTEENAVTGSVPYMSPEQIEDRVPTAPSDVWALAVVLYEAAVGHRPFQRARQSEEVAAILAGRCQPLAAIDPRCAEEVSAIIARCLAPSPAQRPADATVLARELAAYVDWIAPGRAAAERLRLAGSPRDYASSVAPIRAARCAAAARAALATGDRFGASRHLDRGLALAPDDPELRRLVDAAMGATVAPMGPGLPAELAIARSAIAAPSRVGRRVLVLGLLVVALACLIGAIVAARSSTASAPEGDELTRPAHLLPSRGVPPPAPPAPAPAAAPTPSDVPLSKPASVRPSRPAVP